MNGATEFMSLTKAKQIPGDSEIEQGIRDGPMVWLQQSAVHSWMENGIEAKKNNTRTETDILVVTPCLTYKRLYIG